MTYFDKTKKAGYDDLDKELNAELVDMMRRTPPHIQRNMQNRLHDGILQRLKEESTRKCYQLMDQLQKCLDVKGHSWTEPIECLPHRDAVNECVHEVNSEENYQKLRIQYLRGELKKVHEERFELKVEEFKKAMPESLSSWKNDYIPRYTESMEDAGKEPTAAKTSIINDDLEGMGRMEKMDIGTQRE